MNTGCLAGSRILVVEDELLIALLVEQTLQDLGCTVVGPLGKLDEALRAAAAEPLDAAVLDVTIRGGKVFPVAEELIRRKVPFVLASGYGEWSLPDFLHGAPRLTKPFMEPQIEAQVRALRPEWSAAGGAR